MFDCSFAAVDGIYKEWLIKEARIQRVNEVKRRMNYVQSCGIDCQHGLSFVLCFQRV